MRTQWVELAPTVQISLILRGLVLWSSIQSHFRKQAALGRGITNVPIRTSSCPLIFSCSSLRQGEKNRVEITDLSEGHQNIPGCVAHCPLSSPLVATLLSHLCWCFSPNPQSLRVATVLWGTCSQTKQMSIIPGLRKQRQEGLRASLIE